MTKRNWPSCHYVVILDFDARLPVPFSVFPSFYRNKVSKFDCPQVHHPEPRLDLSNSQPNPEGRGDHSVSEQSDSCQPIPCKSSSIPLSPPPIVDSKPPPASRQPAEYEFNREKYSQPYQSYVEAHIDVPDRVYTRDFQPLSQPDSTVLESSLDSTERRYRQGTFPSEQPRAATLRSPVQVAEEHPTRTKASESRGRRFDMGYYDEDGHYHSLRQGLHRAADRILHPFEHHHHQEYQTTPAPGYRQTTDREVVTPLPASRPTLVAARKMPPNAVPIPCHHIRIGDLLVLQGRPCQVIRISTSAQTGQHRYLGVDLFSKQLHEESSFISNPSPSVFVQNMYGPVFKQYRVLDICSDGRVVAMTESGDIKQGLPVLDQNDLFRRLSHAFDQGKGSVRVLVVNDNGRELAVDYTVVHGSRL